jgi:DNA topoisomerase-1
MAKATRTKKSLVVVESPAKAKTINRYLGPEFEVKASMGHVRDLPTKGLNVEIENNFKPTYEVVPGRKRIVGSLKSAARKSKSLYLATDLDREGEAIAWHLAQVLGVPEEQVYRVVFNAITKNAIQSAFSSPGRINMDKVMAQQARRILDRIVGYQISPLLWRKVARGLSAGRVQSVAVKMVVERERQITQFKPEEYWLIPAVFSTDLNKDYQQQWLDFLGVERPEEKGPTIAEQNDWLADRNAFKAELHEVGGEKFHASTKQQADRIFEALRNAEFSVGDVQTKRSVSKPPTPFITSTLQQAAANYLNFTTSRTMIIAQQLYEGIDLGSMGALGLITYMRTDSTHLSQEALNDARNYIGRNVGADYLPEKPNVYVAKKSAQQAHEAIRPTDPDLTPDDIKPFLTDEQYRLYQLIWRRFLACQMKPAEWDVTTLQIIAQTSVGPCCYKASGRVQLFEGFMKLWQPNNLNDPRLPILESGQRLKTVDIHAVQNFTKPPARYTEASLVKALEKEDIGRPSTYAAIISTIQTRGYVEKTNGKFHATDTGEVVTDKLNEYFPNIMDLSFTRHMEQQLDKIEEQHLDWLSVLNEFYGPFKKSLDKAAKQMKHAKAETKPSQYNCPKCGSKLVYRFGKTGKFLSCSAYPDCKFSSPCDKEGKMLQDQPSEHKCSTCGSTMVYRHGRFGPFLACSSYPECKTVLKLDKDGNVLPPSPPPEPTGLKCHKCNQGELVIRQSKRGPFLGCSRFPKCRTIVSIKNLETLKRLQSEGNWPPQQPEQIYELLGTRRRKNSAVK